MTYGELYDGDFNNWTDGEAKGGGMKCSKCVRAIDSDRVFNASRDDEILCGVCAGDEFECPDCAEVFEMKEQMSSGRCEGCHEEAAVDDENDLVRR